MLEKVEDKYTKYEVARILGARSLQLAMDAPVLLKMTKADEEELNFDSLRTAEKELISEVLPISVRRPLPKKSEKTVKKLSEEEIERKLEKQKELEAKELAKIEAKKENTEETEESKIKEEGEIMELASPSDEEAPQEEKPEGREEIQ